MKDTRLIYYIWIPDNMTAEQEKLMRLHMYCVKRKAKIFWNATIIISIDVINDVESINKYKKEIASWGIPGDIKIMVVENDKYKREGYYFKTELIDKLKENDEITFFAHTKGLSNVKNGTYDNTAVNIDSVYKWVMFMYFCNLDMSDYALDTFYGRDYISYGGLLLNNQKVLNQYNWIYSGGFSWINNHRLYDYINLNGLYIPINNCRTYGENFLGEIIPFDFRYINSFEWRYFSDIDPYQYMDYPIEHSISNSKYYDEFFEFVEELKKEGLYNEK